MASPRRVARGVALGVALLLIATACGSDDDAGPRPGATGGPGATTSQAPPPDRSSEGDPAVTSTEPATTANDECAHVVGVEITTGAGGLTFAVTVSSTETGWDKYADAWVVKTPDGTVVGERVLAHPHVDEQPFTRSQSGIVIPDGVTTVVVAARDSVLGFCGDEMTVSLGEDGA